MYSCPAAPCAQERAPQASRLLPQPAPWAPLWKEWACEGHTSMRPGLLRFHQPLPLHVPVSCRSSTAQPGSTPRPYPFLPLTSAGVSRCPGLGERAHGTGGGRGVGCAASPSVWSCPPGAGGAGNACAVRSTGQGPSRPTRDEVMSCRGHAGRVVLSLARGDSHGWPGLFQRPWVSHDSG